MKCHECEVGIEDVGVNVDGGVYCQECFEEKYIICDGCEQPILKDDSYQGLNGESLCSACYHDRYGDCYDCGTTICVGDGTYVGEDLVCDHCYQNHYFNCEHCGTSYHNDDYGEDGYCRYCCEDSDSERNDEERCIRINSEDASVGEIEATLCLLAGEMKRLRLRNRCNSNDIYLDEIVSQVGLVDDPVYLYGLIDREEYGLLVDPDTFKFLDAKGSIHTVAGKDIVAVESFSFIPIVRHIHDRHIRAIGISRALREDFRDWVCNFVANITKKEEEVCVG